MKNDLHLENEMNFQELIDRIGLAHNELSAQASKAVNISLTLRNWLIGYHIHKYELNGSDRAEYGKNLLSRLSDDLKKQQISNCGKRQLYYYLCFYQGYPQIVGTLNAQLKSMATLAMVESTDKVRSMTALSKIDPQKLLNSLSYTHFEQLLRIEDETKRTFYEI